jgi:hypothetical protein
MTNHALRTRAALAVVATVLATLHVDRPAYASDEFAQVRPMTRRVAHLIHKGTRRSPTIARLLQDVAGSDVVVYVRSSRKEPVDLAGSTGFLGRGADGRRWLMVTLYGDAGGTTLEQAEDRQLITLGHELRHVLEVATADQIATVDDFVAHYRRIGDEWRPSHVDTDEARAAGRQVARELTALRW